MRDRAPRRIGELLDGALPGRLAAALQPIVRAWREAVGEDVATNAWPARLLRDGTLVVHCSSAVWASELSLQAERTLERLRLVLEAPPSALRFKVGPVPIPRGAPQAARVPPPTREQRLAADDAAARIHDPVLREAAARAIAQAIARAAAGPSEPA